MSGEKLQAALEWAARGFRIFPLRPGSKKPMLGDGWTDLATVDRPTIEAWWGSMPHCNIGVLTDNLIVVDVDDKNGKSGTKAFVDLDLPWNTLVVRTPTGGRHVYYSGPNKQNSVDKLARGLDIRSYHGYVIAPGSYLDERDPANNGGGFYTLDNDAPILPAPTALVARLEAPRERLSTHVPAAELDTPEAIHRASEYARNVEPGVFGSGADAHTYKVACVVKDMGLSKDLALSVLAEHYLPRCFAPRGPDEQFAFLARKVDNAYDFGTSAPGIRTPEAEFGGVKIDLPATQEVQARKWFKHGDPWQTSASWLYLDLLPETGVALLVGPSQGGKTFVGLELARSLATGKEFFGVAPEEAGGTALLFAGTEGSGLAKRLAALGEETPLPIAATETGVLGQSGALAGLENDLRSLAGEMAVEFGVPLKLVILETLSACGLLEDENDNAKAAMAMAALGVLSRRLGVLFVVTHHPPKDGKGERGAGAIRNSVDYVLEVTREGKQAVRDLELTKARDAEQRMLGSFTLIRTVIGEDDRGREVSSCVVSAGAASARRPVEAAQGPLLIECVEWSLIDSGQVVEGQTVVDEDDVRDIFYERKGGSRPNAQRAYKSAMLWAVEMGRVRQVHFAGRVYLHLSDLY